MQGVVVACQCPNQQWHDQIWTVMDCSYLFIIHNYLPISLLFPDISPLNFICFSFVGEISKPLTISPSQFGWCFTLQIFEDCAELHPLSFPRGNESSILHEGSCKETHKWPSKRAKGFTHCTLYHTGWVLPLNCLTLEEPPPVVHDVISGPCPQWHCSATSLRVMEFLDRTVDSMARFEGNSILYIYIYLFIYLYLIYIYKYVY